jgi:hypothetical protein
MYSYVLKCDGCGIKGDESRSGEPWLMPAGWYVMTVKRAGFTEADAAFCPECWENKTCKEAFATIPWRRV